MLLTESYVILDIRCFFIGCSIVPRCIRNDGIWLAVSWQLPMTFQYIDTYHHVWSCSTQHRLSRDRKTSYTISQRHPALWWKMEETAGRISNGPVFRFSQLTYTFPSTVSHVSVWAIIRSPSLAVAVGILWDSANPGSIFTQTGQRDTRDVVIWNQRWKAWWRKVLSETKSEIFTKTYSKKW